MLVQGREQAYLAWIFATKSTRSYAIDSAALQEYTRQYSAPGAMRAGFAWYRVNFGEEGLAQAKARAAKRLTMPVWPSEGPTAWVMRFARPLQRSEIAC